MTRPALLSLVFLLAAGCASATLIPDTDRAQLEKKLTGESRYLKVSLYKGPFWQDEDKVLLSDVPPNDLNYLTDTKGEVIRAGGATGVVEAGRRAKIIKVEFPTAVTVAGRMIYTPRFNPWVYLQVDGEDPKKPQLMVFRDNIKTQEEFQAQLARLLTEDDVAPKLAAYPEGIRQAILTKQIVRDMDPAAVEMAWGYPQKKSIEIKGQERSEVWTYSAGVRTVTLQDGKVLRSQDGLSGH
jgi:hypothetical protein